MVLILVAVLALLILYIWRRRQDVEEEKRFREIISRQTANNGYQKKSTARAGCVGAPNIWTGPVSSESVTSIEEIGISDRRYCQSEELTSSSSDGDILSGRDGPMKKQADLESLSAKGLTGTVAGRGFLHVERKVQSMQDKRRFIFAVHFSAFITIRNLMELNASCFKAKACNKSKQPKKEIFRTISPSRFKAR